MPQQAADEVAAVAEARGWVLGENGEYTFESEVTNNNAVNANEMIKRQLQYARDLEQIV